MADSPRWWRRLATVRARTTVAATVIVGLAVVLAAVILVILLRRSLVTNVDEVAEIRAEDIAALARQGPLPATLAASGDDGALAQVVDGSGRVVATSPGLESDEPIADFRPSGPEAEIRTVDDLPVDDGPFRVVALPATTADGVITVYVAASLEPVDETIEIVRRSLIVGLPVLLALIAVASWFVVGRALHPIDAMQAEVADISERSLDRRVPVPPTHDEVSRLAGTMNAMLDRLQAAADRQRRFVADASHELQTPLASARTDLEVGLAHPDRTDWRQTATDLLAANRRMETLVRDLLFLARADSGAAKAPAVALDLDDVVMTEVARARTAARVTLDTSRVSAAAVMGHHDDLARVVRNLLDNAERYATSAVTVELTMNDGHATFVIADDGPGIPVGDRARVFERFTRLDDARTRSTGGSGLGLAIAKDIVDAHGGTITVEDGTAGGARFVVRLRAI